MKKIIVFFAVIVMATGMAFARTWTVKMETSVQEKWRDVASYDEIDKGGTTGPTRTITVDADTKAEALERAKSICYDACDSNWIPEDVVEQDGKTYRVYKRYVLTNYYVED